MSARTTIFPTAFALSLSDQFEIQKILREFRAPASERATGVLIHGLGRQGKSSLAARIAQRLEQSHELLVIYGSYDGAAILAAFRDRLATASVTEICNRYLPLVEADPAQLLPALTELLEGRAISYARQTASS